ncbi:Spy/CpxP family protein refolding chaperone [Zhongshania sp.]|uniref:Spy/CpxP family protein refolding chaperone n=1 Tax=Zhongshania sp. TaxID=1971902 RepID=UPI0035679858
MRQLFATLFALAFAGGFGINVATAQVAGINDARFAVLIEKLALSTAQQEKVSAILASYAENAANVREGLVKVQQNIQSANLARLDADDVLRISREAGRLSAAHTASLLNTQRGFYALLTVEQRRKYNEMRSEAVAQQAGGLPNK